MTAYVYHYFATVLNAEKDGTLTTSTPIDSGDKYTEAREVIRKRFQAVIAERHGLEISDIEMTHMIIKSLTFLHSVNESDVNV